MGGTLYEKTVKFLDNNRISLLVFFCSMFLFLSFGGTRLFISDEGLIINQFYNLVHGSLAIKMAKIGVSKGMYFLFNNNLYIKFSYALPVLSLPAYYLLKSVNFIYGAHLFLLQFWAFSAGIIVYLAARCYNIKNAVFAGLISYLFLITINLIFFKPIYFPVWGEVLAIEFTNIIISSFLVLVVFLLFRDIFNQKIGLIASFFILLATPVSFYAITLKHHSLALLLTLLSFYFFYKYYKNKDNRFIYLAYASAGLCIWTRILDGAALLGALLITDIMISRHIVRRIIPVLIVILISTAPLFVFNYLILGDPFYIIESVPPMTEQYSLITTKDDIKLNNNMDQQWLIDLFNKLGYDWKPDINTDWVNVLLNITLLKLGNNFGIFLVSPFLITAFGFWLERLKQKIKFNPLDKLFMIYTILFIFLYINYFTSIVTDTPATLEYRYMLIFYVILFYFAMRIEYLRKLIKNNLKKIFIVSAFMILLILLYFIIGFPVAFLKLYYIIALVISLFLISILSLRITIPGKIPKAVPVDSLLLFLTSISIALAFIFLLYYYWIATISYLYPSQNHTIVPVLEYMIKWMYQNVFLIRI